MRNLHRRIAAEIISFLAFVKKEAIRTYQSLHLFLCAANDPEWMAKTGFLKDVIPRITMAYVSAFIAPE